MRHVVILLCLSIAFHAFSQDNVPVITGQTELTTARNEPLTITLNNLTVVDTAGESYPDYPAGFTLEVFGGENYTTSGSTITPATDFVGTLSVPVRVNDGTHYSDTVSLAVTVLAPDDDGDDDGGGDDGGGDDGPSNVAPVIIGQAVLSIEEGTSLAIELNNLFVNDPDDTYPDGFSLTVSPGVNYTVTGNTVTPATDFVGTLIVPVSVNDGEASSAPFNLSITVTAAPVNVSPVIVGQSSLSTLRDQPFTITLEQLQVTDPDDPYPTGFTITIAAGTNYTVTGNQVVPAPGFVGPLTVNVSVSDGAASSNVFPFRVDVIEPAVLQITSHLPMETEEDTPLEVNLSDLIVNDPEGRYPNGFQLVIGDGTNYNAEGSTITPAPDFSGNVEVNLYVTDGTRQSQQFTMTILVVPVNDAPVIEGLPESPVQVIEGGGPVTLAPRLDIVDVDNETLNFAELYFKPGSYQPDGDELFPTYSNPALRVVFDPANGALFIVGEAPLSEYISILRSVNYQFNASDSLETAGAKTLELVVSDGSQRSETKQITIEFTETGELDIPTVFTPNDDNANDTWRIGGYQGNLDGQIMIRVFSKKGLLVFESSDLSTPWDGTFNGKSLPPDAYFYTIDLNLPFSRKQYKGVVTILQ